MNQSDITYLLGDAWMGMKGLESNSLDLIITDPPYMDMYSTHKTRSKEENNIQEVFDGQKDFNLFADELYRLIKPACHLYYFTQTRVFCESYISLKQAGFNMRGVVIWVKRHYTRGNWYADYPQQAEYIIYVHKPGERVKNLNGNIHSNILTEFDSIPSSRMIHPTQKPIDLLEYLVKRSSEVGDLVCDPMAGVASTHLACLRTGRRCIGWEIVQPNHNKGLWLIEQTKQNLEN